MMSDAHRLWTMCATLLRAQVSDPVWHTTFEGVRAVDFDGRSLVLGVSSPLAKERIEGRYLGLVGDALTEAGAPDVELLLRIEPPEPPSLWTVPTPPATVAGTGSPSPGTPNGPSPAGPGGAMPTPATWRPGPAPRRRRSEPPLHLRGLRHRRVEPLRPRRRPSRWPRRRPARYNPLFIYGDAGLGKTHLLQAIAHYVDENYPAYKVRYVSTETFLNEFVDVIRSGQPRRVQAALPRDRRPARRRHPVHRGQGEALQEEFFHTFNDLHQANRQIVLSSDRPPDAIATLEDRLRSRFKMGLITDIQPPELETRLAILRKKAEREPARIPRRRARVHRHQHHQQHPRARGRAHPGVGLRQPHPRADHGRPGRAGARRHPQRRASPGRSRRS